MADFDLSKITGREPPLVTDDERDAEIAYLSDVVTNLDRELAALRARVAELEAALRAVAARLDQPVFRGDEKAGSAATARILRADIRSALVVAISAIDAARNAPIAGIGLPANKSPQ